MPRFSPLLLAALVGVTVLFPILWQILRTGTVAVPSGPLAWLGPADLTLSLLIARYASCYAVAALCVER
jgi:hypothetical protein